MTISFRGISSASDRTLFTDRGPIVKRPLPLLTGSDLRVLSPGDVSIPSGSFTSSNVGQLLTIAGSAGGRNDGTFPIAAILSPKRLRLAGASFSHVDAASTVSDVITLANELKLRFNGHVMAMGVHPIVDMSDLVVAQSAVDLSSAVILLNQLRQRVNGHLSTSGSVHPIKDVDDEIAAPTASDLASAVALANAVRRSFEAHRLNSTVHLRSDQADKVLTSIVRATVGTFPGPLTGPFTWTLLDPRTGQIADDPTDVDVFVNGSPVPVDAVFGLSGAVVLGSKPGPSDTVTVNYSWLDNPSTQIQSLNDPGFVLNQQGNRGLSGLPGRKYRSRSSLVIPPESSKTVRSPVVPARVGWKFRALDLPYTACLNDPNTLLLNVPTNRIGFQGVQAVVRETVVRYDPSTLPHESTQPWAAYGDLSGLSLAAGGHQLTIAHTGSSYGTQQLPPFFSHALDLSYPSIVSAAFRACTTSYSPDGDFTGVCFGISDGARAAVVGMLETDAINLSSSITLANALKRAANAHVINTSYHVAADAADQAVIVDASDLPSLIILTNTLKFLFNKHVLNAAVHLSVDTSDLVGHPDAASLHDAMEILNSLRTNFNAHIASNAHVSPDSADMVQRVKQVGFLTSRGHPQFQTSWNCVAADWSEYRTYRIFRGQDGGVSLYFSGVADPVVQASASELPPLSSLDGEFDILQQTFFGTIGKRSSSSSNWAFIRVDVQPLDADQVGSNKSVNYVSSVMPEMDPVAPWITVGQGGYDRISGSLVLDSTSTSSAANVPVLGRASGPYRGFLRLEPSMTSRAVTTLEFSGKVGFYTFSVDNVAAGVFMDDDQTSVHLLYLQASPAPAAVTGSSTEPFNIIPGDTLIFSVDGGGSQTITFSSADTTAAQVAAEISAPSIEASAVGGAVRVQTLTSGSASNLQLLGGSALVKLGFVPGTYFGRDSDPEPKVSWFGANRPDQDTPAWTQGGSQTGTMLDRALRIVDTDSVDFLTYTIDDVLTTGSVFGPSLDWKLDFRLSNVSYSPGEMVSGLAFCGALVNVDEGPGGKSLEVQMSVDSSGSPFVHFVSFNALTGNLDDVARFPFAWNDGKVHSFDVFVSHGAGIVIVLVDGAFLGSFSYSSLNGGVFGPSVTFGSGSAPANNFDPRAATSVFEWQSICVFRDARISDPQAAGNRYVGLYAGGDPAVLSSYYLAQVDWTQTHTYRIIRNPGENVSVYIDGSATPSISVNYDVLTLPPASSSFLKKVANGMPLVAFGSFNPAEIDRTYWDYVRYSIGVITQTDGVVPAHQAQNHGNVVASPEHLLTKSPHPHFGFGVYSGGTPTDDFVADPGIPAYTQLGEGIPPVPMSQDVDLQGGLTKSVTATKQVSPTSFVDRPGFLADFEDDTDNKTSATFSHTYAQVLADLLVKTNSVVAAFNAHLTATDPITGNLLHLLADLGDTVTVPAATDLPSALNALSALLTSFDAHLQNASAGAHVHPDVMNLVQLPAPTDIDGAIDVANQIDRALAQHASQGSYHSVDDVFTGLAFTLPGAPAPTLSWTLSVLSSLATAYNLHIQNGSYHYVADLTVNAVSVPTLTTLSDGLTFASNLFDAFTAHVSNTGGSWHFVPDSDDLPNPSLVSSLSTLGDLMTVTESLLALFNRHVVKTVHPDPRHGSYAAVNLLSPGSEMISGLTGITSALTGGFIRISGARIDGNNGLFMITGVTAPSTVFISNPSGVTDPSNGSIVWEIVDPVHRVADTADLVAGPGPIQALYDSFAAARSALAQHRTHVTVGSTRHSFHKTEQQSSVPDLKPLYNQRSLDFDVPSLVAAVQSLADDFNEHITSSVHAVPDLNDAASFVGGVYDLESASSALTSLAGSYNSHIAGTSWHNMRTLSPASTSSLPHPLASAIAVANASRAAFNSHIVRRRSHTADGGQDAVLLADATDLASLITLVNALVKAYAVHVARSIHVTPDTINLISAPPATDLQSAGYALNAFCVAYSAHVVSPGVHGSSAFIRLQAPDGSLYRGMKLAAFPSGTPGLVTPFSDDAELRLGMSANRGDTFGTYPGGAAPESVVLVGGLHAPYPIITGDTLVLSVDGSAPVTVTFGSSDVSVANVAARINGTAGIPSGFASDNGDGRIRLTSAIATSSSSVEVLGGTAAQKLGLDQSQALSWRLVASDVSGVSLSLLTLGLVDYLRFGTSGTPAAYVAKTGLTDSVSSNFEATFSMRVNAGGVTAGDSGVYFGISGMAGPGFTAAIGFDIQHGSRYVRLVDLNSGKEHFRRLFDWNDGNFHKYRISRDAATQSISVSILS